MGGEGLQDRKVHGVADDVQDVHRLLRELQKDQGVRVVFVRDVALVRSTVHHLASSSLLPKSEADQQKLISLVTVREY